MFAVPLNAVPLMFLDVVSEAALPVVFDAIVFGISSATKSLNPGAAEVPDAGPANTLLAVCAENISRIVHVALAPPSIVLIVLPIVKLLAVCHAVAVPALPVILVWSPVFVPLIVAEADTVRLPSRDIVLLESLTLILKVLAAVKFALLVIPR